MQRELKFFFCQVNIPLMDEEGPQTNGDQYADNEQALLHHHFPDTNIFENALLSKAEDKHQEHSPGTKEREHTEEIREISAKAQLQESNKPQTLMRNIIENNEIKKKDSANKESLSNEQGKYAVFKFMVTL